MRNKTAHTAAFSLVELMFVLAIMAILSTVATLALRGTAESAKKQKTTMNMNTIGAALNLYQVRHNAYPPSSMGTQALINAGLLDKVVKDGWDREFSYTSPTPAYPDGFEIMSSGKDGQWNTADDIIFDPGTDQ
jgi:general secretion pathway protein G